MESKPEQFYLSRVAGELALEMRRASQSHAPFNSAHEGYAVIEEEFDEVKKEVFKKNRDLAKLRSECIQLGAMVIRMIHDVCDKGKDMEG